MSYENKISVKMDVLFDDIDEILWNRNNGKLIIKQKDGSSLKIVGEDAIKTYKTLCRNYPGEHLD